MFDDGDEQELNEREYYLGVLTGLRAPEAMARAQDRDFRGACKRCDQEVARLPDGTASAYCGRYCMHGKGHDKLYNANGEPMCEVGFCPNAGRPLGNKKFDAACCNSHALLLDARGAAAAAEEICVNNLESRLQRMATTNAKAWASKQADPKRVERAELASDYDAMQQSNVCFNNRVCFNGYECGKEKNPMPQLRLPPSEGDTVKDLKQQNEYLQSELRPALATSTSASRTRSSSARPKSRRTRTSRSSSPRRRRLSSSTSTATSALAAGASTTRACTARPGCRPR